MNAHELLHGRFFEWVCLLSLVGSVAATRAMICRDRRTCPKQLLPDDPNMPVARQTATQLHNVDGEVL